VRLYFISSNSPLIFFLAGDIGLSPAAGTALTGFSAALAPGGTFETSTQVTGRLLAASFTSPTPSTLTTAVSDMQTAFTDASGRVNPNFLNLNSGNPFFLCFLIYNQRSRFTRLGAIGGLTLAPGLYKWTSAVNAASGVTISGSATDSMFRSLIFDPLHELMLCFDQLGFSKLQVHSI